MADIIISSGTVTCLGISAALCIALPFIIWIYMWRRVHFSQAIFGFLFCCAVVLLENLADSYFLADGSSILANSRLYTAYLSVSLALLQVLGLFGAALLLKSKYDTADAAVGAAVGFALMELFMGGVTNLVSYAMAMYCNKNGIDAMAAAVEADNLQTMLDQLRVIAETSPTTYLLSGFNRVFYTIQIVCVSVLGWFAAKNYSRVWLLAVALVMQSLCRLPFGLYTAGLMTDFIREEVYTYLLTAAFALIAGFLYNKYEPKNYKFKAEKLRARRRR